VSVRSRPLLGLALALLAGAAVLGTLLHHDGALVEGGTDLMDSEAGDDVRFKGVVQPFLTPPESRLTPALGALLSDYTYILEDAQLEGDGLLVLVTGDEPHIDTDAVVVSGTVLHRGLHPDRSGRVLLIVQADDWTAPILFR